MAIILEPALSDLFLITEIEYLDHTTIASRGELDPDIHNSIANKMLSLVNEECFVKISSNSIDLNYLFWKNEDYIIGFNKTDIQMSLLITKESILESSNFRRLDNFRNEYQRLPK